LVWSETVHLNKLGILFSINSACIRYSNCYFKLVEFVQQLKNKMKHICDLNVNYYLIEIIYYKCKLYLHYNKYAHANLLCLKTDIESKRKI